jgi:MarR family transcriptional regulator, transcriptional regulator for hemolysin
MNTLAYLGFALEGAGRLYLRRFEERAREFALEPMGCKVLLVLAENEGITQQRLAELTVLDPSTTGRLLDRLEAKGLVERRRRPRDRRARSVALTRQAVELLPSLWRAARDSLSDALTGLSTTQRCSAMGALRLVLSNLDRSNVRSDPRDGPPDPSVGSGSGRS